LLITHYLGKETLKAALSKTDQGRFYYKCLNEANMIFEIKISEIHLGVRKALQEAFGK